MRLSLFTSLNSRALLAAAALLALSSCSDKPADGYLIKGKVKNPVPGGYVVLRKFIYQTTDMMAIDSVQPDKEGAYQFVGKLPEDNFMQVSSFGKQDVLFLGQNQTIEVNADGTGSDGAREVKGTKENELLARMIDLRKRQEREMGPMIQELNMAAQNRDQARMSQYIEFINRANAYFARRYHGLIDSAGPSMVAWYGTKLLNPDDEFSYLDSLGRQFQKAHPDAPWARDFTAGLDNQRKQRQFEQEAKRKREATLGQPAPALAMPTPEGKTLSTAGFKGKVLLIDFWASWCRPCRQKSPEMVALYQRFKGKGVEFVGVSLDVDQAKWTEAIAQDGLPWPQMSDLKGWDSDAKDKYSLDAIPHVVILDRQGRIAAAGIDGPELERKLEELTASM